MNLTANIVLYNHFTNAYRSLKGFLKMVIDHEKCWQHFIISSLWFTLVNALTWTNNEQSVYVS